MVWKAPPRRRPQTRRPPLKTNNKAESGDVAGALRDEALQRLLLKVDGAPDRERVRWFACRRVCLISTPRPPPTLCCSARAKHTLPLAPFSLLRALNCTAKALQAALEDERFRRFADQVTSVC